MFENYQGKPFQDILVQGEPQQIPGRLMCAYYDLGGEGIAYHDTTRENHGSGALNTANGEYRNEFRMDESVDISYTKPGFDDTKNNIVQPEMGMFYVGWTDPGEWLRYTVEVHKGGVYRINFLYAAAVDAVISLSIDNTVNTGFLDIPATHHAHNWNMIKPLTELHLTSGKHILTLHTEKQGLMNYAYLDFDFDRD